MMSKTETTDAELSDADHLFSVAEHTTDDGTVMAKVLDWERVDRGKGPPKVAVELLMPAGVRKTVFLDWPQADSRAHKFVRVLDEAGWGLRNADQLVGDRVPCQVTNGNVEIQTQRTFLERFRQMATNENALFMLTVLAGAVFGSLPVFLFFAINEPQTGSTVINVIIGILAYVATILSGVVGVVMLSLILSVILSFSGIPMTVDNR